MSAVSRDCYLYAGGIAGDLLAGTAKGKNEPDSEVKNCSVGNNEPSTSVRTFFFEAKNDRYSHSSAGGIAGYIHNSDNDGRLEKVGLNVSNNYLRLTAKADRTDTLTYGYRQSAKDTFENNTAVRPDSDIESKALKPIVIPEKLECTKGTACSVQLQAVADSAVTWSYTGKLPAGLTLSETGLLSGTPAEGGTFALTVTASNSAGTDSREMTITVLDAPMITTSELPAATQGIMYSTILTASGTLPITWHSTSTMPAGITLSEDGTISGIPTTAGVYTFTVIAKNVVSSDTKKFSLTVAESIVTPTAAAPAITTAENLGTFTAGDSVSIQLIASGTKPITWTHTGGELPSGVTLGNTGLISGTATTAGTFSFTVIASNSAGNDSRTFTITVNEPAPTATAPAITTTSLPPSTVGRDYRAELEASGSTPITWTYTGSMIMGLTLSEAGVISGIPLEAGTHTLTVKASNQAGSDTKSLMLSVRGSPASVPVIKTKKLPEGYIDAYYSYTLDADGDVDEWMLEGDVPSGLEIDAATGEISGTISTNKAQTFKLKVTAHNDAGDSKTQTLGLKISSKAPGFKTNTLKSAMWHKKYSATIRLASFKASSWECTGDLPDGMMFANGKISGIPQEVGEFEFTVTATNGAVEIAQDFEIAVKGVPPKLKGSFKTGNVGEAYSSVLKAAGITPIEWDFWDLPDGLDFEPDDTGETCTISGFPQKAFNDKVLVTLTNGSGDDSSIRKSLKMTVKCIKPKFKTKAKQIPDGWINEGYEAQLVLSAGSPAIEWEYSGNMPDGLTLTDEGLIEGTPKKAGKFTFSVTAKNDAGKANLKNVTVTIFAARESVPYETKSSRNKYESLPEFVNGVTYCERGGLSAEILARAANSDEIIAAILPKIEVEEANTYDFTVELDEAAPEGATLVWHSYPDGENDPDDPGNAIFLDDSGEITERVPETHSVTVSAWLEPGHIYEPVIAVKISRQHH